MPGLPGGCGGPAAPRQRAAGPPARRHTPAATERSARRRGGPWWQVPAAVARHLLAGGDLLEDQEIAVVLPRMHLPQQARHAGAVGPDQDEEVAGIEAERGEAGHDLDV